MIKHGEVWTDGLLHFPAGVGAGRLAGRFGDVCEEAAGDGPGGDLDGGGRPSSRLPQPGADLQGDAVRLRHLRVADPDGLPAGRRRRLAADLAPRRRVGSATTGSKTAL